MDLLKNLDDMITAEEYIMENTDIITMAGNKQKVSKAMIEFAKMHVEAALKEASEKAEWKGYTLAAVEICNYSILDAYPLENIK